MCRILWQMQYNHAQTLRLQITAVVSGTIVYGAVSLFKVCSIISFIRNSKLTITHFQKYLSPHLKPPDTTVYEDDRDALTAQFDAAEALLKEIQSETAAVKQAVEEQKEKVDKTTKDVEAVVSEMRESEFKARDEMREVRDEINTIREMLPKVTSAFQLVDSTDAYTVQMIEKNKESQNQSLAELQQELKSLKALLLSRGPTMSNAPSPVPMVGRPSIPAWQLASSNGSSTPGATPSIPAWQLSGSNGSSSPGAASANAPTPAIPLSSAPSTPAANGKGKERDISETSS